MLDAKAVTPASDHRPTAPSSHTLSRPPIKMPDYSPGLNGIVIGLLSSFGSAIIIASVALIYYCCFHTASGRILLARFGRPGEYDDEQAFAREEAEALEVMDDMQRTEYLRAKGRSLIGGYQVERRHSSQFVH